MDPYFEAISQFRRRNFEKCIEICNTLLKTELENTNSRSAIKNKCEKILNTSTPVEGVWHLKMMALTQRVFVSDLEMDENDFESEEAEFERIATSARPGTSIKTAFVRRPGTRFTTTSAGRPLTAMKMKRVLTGIARPGTVLSRPGSTMNARPQSRCATAHRVCITSANAYSLHDSTLALFQAFRLNPTIYADKLNLVKPLFQFLFYHEKNPAKALMLCETVADTQRQKVKWWWNLQRGRCLLAVSQFRRAEQFLMESLSNFPHPDTFLLLCKLYLKLNQPEKALQLLNVAVEKNSSDTCFKIQQARVYEYMEKVKESIEFYKITIQYNPVNTEALACIAINLFYDNQPEMALMYYRRILSLGVTSAELYCNIGLCCLYGGPIDLVLPCFQRAIQLASTPEQRADIWYNLSFVAIITGDLNLAKRCLRLSLVLNASNGAALNNLAVLCAQNGQINKAKSYLTAAENAAIDCDEIKNNIEVVNSFLNYNHTTSKKLGNM